MLRTWRLLSFKNLNMQQSIKYQNLSRKECGQVYLEILENANELYEEAEIIAQVKKDRFGRPISSLDILHHLSFLHLIQ